MIRRVPTVLVTVGLVGALTAWLGRFEASLPSAVSGGQATVPVWRLFALVAATMPIVAMHSRLADLELVATRRLRHQQRLYLVGMGTGCALLHIGIAAVTLPVPVLLILARSWPAWFGLALLAGSVAGWRLSWVLPVATAGALVYWGYRGDGRYAWWEFSARPHDDVPSLVLSLTLLVVGLTAYAATPWRRRRWQLGRRR
jgi:hypothetical protein